MVCRPAGACTGGRALPLVLALQGSAWAPDYRPHIILRCRRLTKTESKKGVGLIETELARSASETSDAAAAARSGRDMEDVGTSCIVGTVRGEDYNFQVRLNASALACCCSCALGANLEG